MLNSRQILVKSFKSILPKVTPLQVSKRYKSLYDQTDFSIEYLENERQGIAVATMKRIAAKNALSKSFIQQFDDGINRVKREMSVNVMILRSAVPSVFCAGADLKERLEMHVDHIGPMVSALRDLSLQISSLPFPTIAALDGLAVGGGFEFALSCDIRVAATNANVGLVETKLAIIPGAGGTQRLSRLVGPSVAKDLIFTARILSAEEAYKLGMVNRLVEQDVGKQAAYQASLTMAEQINANAPIALRMAKQAIDKGLEASLEEGLFLEKAFYSQVIPTADRIEGLKSFVEKRVPKYTGQ